ncbi:hypothetical protein O3P69_011988 [Scylla paramamosain]
MGDVKLVTLLDVAKLALPPALPACKRHPSERKIDSHVFVREEGRTRIHCLPRPYHFYLRACPRPPTHSPPLRGSNPVPPTFPPPQPHLFQPPIQDVIRFSLELTPTAGFPVAFREPFQRPRAARQRDILNLVYLVVFLVNQSDPYTRGLDLPPRRPVSGCGPKDLRFLCVCLMGEE